MGTGALYSDRLKTKPVTKMTIWLLLMNSVEMSQSYRAIQGDTSLVSTKSPGVPGTHLIDLGRMEGRADLRAT